MVELQEILENSKSDKDTNYNILELLDSVGDFAEELKKYKVGGISKEELNFEGGEELSYTIINTAKIANNLDIDLEKQLEGWLEEKELKEKEIGIKEGYEEVAEKYSKAAQAALVTEKEVFYDLVGEVKGKKILDAGCGTGRYSIALAKNGAEVKGIDLSEGMLEVAREKARKEGLEIDFEKASIMDIPYQNNSFDIVISNLVFGHLEKPEKAIEEMTRVCKKGGKIIISLIHPNRDISRTEFKLDERKLLLRRYPQSIPNLVKSLNKHGALIEEMIEQEVSEKVKELDPRIYYSLKGKDFLLLIKAKKINSKV